ncbi:hypothetical protein MMC22_000444 [Lobaria immixta]|nr:hypothetical protein [Lobaria immixta]
MGLIESNQACWQNEARAKVTLGPAVNYTPGPGEILVKNEYIGISPIDWLDQKSRPNSSKVTIHAKSFPTILGTSFAGTVQNVGPDVTTFQPNDIVAVNRSDKTLSDARYGVFQKFVVTSTNTTAKLSPNASLPSAAATIINLATGGSSSCGGLGIKYASDAGYTVITTSSPQNRDFVASLGAAEVIDHTQSLDEVVAQLEAYGPYYGILDLISKPETHRIWAKLLADKGGLVYGTLPNAKPDTFPPNVEYKFLPYSWVLEDKKHSDWARWFYDEYVPQGLQSGQIIPTRHILLEGGLEKVQESMDKLASEGISGHKYVLKL